MTLIFSAAVLPGWDNARLIPLNSAARHSGIPTLEFVWAGFDHGSVRVTLPTGDVLIGEYRVRDDVGYVNTLIPEAPTPGYGRLIASAGNAKGVRMNCRGTTQPGGRGSGICEISGRKYQFVF